MTRRNRVTPEMALAVFERDQGCLAPRLGGSMHDCWGRNRIEHVKLELRAARRAEPTMETLATLCQGHTEDGMKAGYVWATDSVNREALRAHLHKVSA